MSIEETTYLPLQARPMKNRFCLFDLDGTLCPENQAVSPEMHLLLRRLRSKCTIGYVSGGSLNKQQWQASTLDVPVTSLFDFCFAENGLTAFRLGVQLTGNNFVRHIGEENYKRFVNWVLRYIADLDIPIKRGTFVEFRSGNVNISPVGQGATPEEMESFQCYDREHGIRKAMIEKLKAEFSELNLTGAIGGKTCFDVFPVGWSKTYCLKHVEAEKERSNLVYDEIHFFGDKIYYGGNDYELYEDERTIGHGVESPQDTMRQIKKLFGL
ncbi:putative Phosphomannomutase [Seiridium unicorne]|uniref:Phosphomannomutase n=1 Tax=Seiridium unicorne TaxID=138068 RepID=A0ABR2VBN5_9PEZI